MDKNKNKSKEAEKRRGDGETNLKRLGLSLNSDLFSVGIIFDNLKKSQMNEDSFNSINYIFNNFVGVDISIFTHDLDEPCIFVLSPILDLRFMFSWTYPLIVMGKSTLQTALNSKSKNIYLYAYNRIEETVSDPRVKIITKEMIGNFDLVKIIKLIVEELKNEK